MGRKLYGTVMFRSLRIQALVDDVEAHDPGAVRRGEEDAVDIEASPRRDPSARGRRGRRDAEGEVAEGRPSF